MLNQIHHQTPLVVWALVADMHHARIFRCRKVSRVIPLSGTTKMHYFERQEGYEITEIPEMTTEANRDYHGHDVSSTRSDLHDKVLKTLNRNFVTLLAKQLEMSHAGHYFDKLILVAPARMIGELQKGLSHELQNCIAAVLPKDLTAFTGNTLLSHLQDTLAEAQVA